MLYGVILLLGLAWGRILKGWVRENYPCRSEILPESFPLLEILNALAWVSAIWQWGLTPKAMAALFLFSLCIVISWVDLNQCLIPDSLTLLLLLAGLVYHFIGGDLSLVNRGIGMAGGFLALFLLVLLSRGGLGGGDVKLMAAMGFWLGFPAVFYALFLGALLGSIAGTILIILGRKQRKDYIPFGPFLVMGFLWMFLR